jgi:hypothetical protein
VDELPGLPVDLAHVDHQSLTLVVDRLEASARPAR